MTTHIWSEGPGPYPKAIPQTIVSYCGEALKDGERWYGGSLTTAELLRHTHDESRFRNLCMLCLRVLASRPTLPCSAGGRCTGDFRCDGRTQVATP